MNETFVAQLLAVLDQYGVRKTTPHHVPVAPAGKDTKRPFSRQFSCLRLMDLLWEEIPEKRWIIYDAEFIEGGVQSFTDLLGAFANATLGEWDPKNMRERAVQRDGRTFILLDFEFKDQPLHWEFCWSGGRAIEECEEAIHQFASHH